MGLAHQSIATISSPQFINLQPLDINPLMSSCEIKVLYLGTNRNGSYISKEVATEMSKTLRGAPIVGYFKKDKQDFADHGQQMIWDDEGIKFNCLTKPYGFVSPDAKVWFKDFEDSDEFGNTIVRTYLMTTGYLWTEQFEEAKKVFEDDGKPHSMELDSKTVQGHWSTNIKEDMEFFIINDAIFSKLCILGDDVEPCFEGSAITAPQVSASFTLDQNFKQTLFEMMQELTYALKGGKTVTEVKDNVLEVETPEVFTEESQDNTEESLSLENELGTDNAEFTSDEANTEKFQEEGSETAEVEENNTPESEELPSEFAKNDQEEKKEEQEDEESDSNEEEDDEDDKKKYTVLQKQYDNLQLQFVELQKENEELKTFKNNIINAQKDELIKQFYMLSDEDKKDVVENKEKYTLEEIESKLAVICFKKKVNFNLNETSENDNTTKDDSIITFNVDNKQDSTPDWVKQVELTMNSRF